MGIFSNIVSIRQFQVIGDLRQDDLFEWATERLGQSGFHSIDDSLDETSLGWVSIYDSSDSTFSVPSAFWHDHYLTFALRLDQRKVPPSLFKAHLEKAENEFLAGSPGLKWIPKNKRKELRESVHNTLFAKTLPVPSICDAVWDTASDLVTFTNLGPKTSDRFIDLFEKTFQGLGLIPYHPFLRAERILSEDLRRELRTANQASSGAVLDQIRNNQWLGRDFLLWLIYQTLNHSSEYAINQPGPALEGERFVAYLNDRLVLLGGGETGMQKITVAGPQDHFGEVHSALISGKDITEAGIYLEKEEYVWKTNLKSEMFHFASFKSPAVKMEAAENVDRMNERESAFYERMHTIEEGLQLFNSLYASFLQERLNKEWVAKEKLIRDWLASDWRA